MTFDEWGEKAQDADNTDSQMELYFCRMYADWKADREERYRAGIEAVLKFFEEGDESTMWRVYEITDAIERILEAQTQEEEKT